METNAATRTRGRRKQGLSPRLFSLDHANRTLPLVRRIVGDIVEQHKIVRALEEKCEAPEGDGTDDPLEALKGRYAEALDRIQKLADEISAVGCDLKDRRRGVVDFRTKYRGREVEMCWRLGEEKIEYWHECDTGYHGRQTIDSEFTADVLRAEPIA